MHRHIPDRVRLPIAIFALLVICLLSSGVSIRRASNTASAFLPTNDFAGALHDMRGSLPARGVVGYVDGGHDTPAELQDYYLAQYALAPLVVARSSNQNVVIGNFSRSKSAPPDNLVRVRDFGHGVALFETKSSLLAARSH
jgi:hypothetical protein